MTLHDIRLFDMKQKYVETWSDLTFIKYTLPCGVILHWYDTGFLEGLDGFLYITHLQELELVHKMTLEQLFDYIEQIHPAFDRTEFE